jgi:hypothetical protein
VCATWWGEVECSGKEDLGGIAGDSKERCANVGHVAGASSDKIQRIKYHHQQILYLGEEKRATKITIDNKKKKKNWQDKEDNQER